MKKFISGFLTGAVLLGVISAFATNYEAITAAFPILVNGIEWTTEKPIVTIDGSTYLPLRALGDALDVKVDWNDNTQSVKIETIPISFLSIFTNADSACLLNFSRIDSSGLDPTFIIDSVAGGDSPSYHPYVRMYLWNDEREFIIDGKFVIVRGNQAVHYHNDDYDRRIIFTLLPNGNVQVEEYGLDFGLNGEYECRGVG